MPGPKSLVHDGQRLLLRTRLGRGVVRLALSLALKEGAAYAFAVPSGRRARALAKAAMELADALAGVPVKGRSAPVTRTMLVHMRSFQALDAEAAGASDRDIAQTIFGSAPVAEDWNDSALRANVRYLLDHGRAFRDGGYRALLRSGESKPPKAKR